MASSLEARSQYISDFAAHVSHEFKTPLTAIRGSAELLMEHAGAMSKAERGKFLANIISDTGRLRALVSRLLELARADNMQQVDTTIDIAAAIGRLATAHRSDRISIVCTGEARVEACICEESLEIIAANLIQNSVQAGATAIEIELEACAAGAEITFRDNGSGVSERNQRRLFEPFFTTRRDCGGTGLGLGIVRSLLAAQRGTIRFAPGTQGATFAITLPGECRGMFAAPAGASLAGARAVALAHGGKWRILSRKSLARSPEDFASVGAARCLIGRWAGSAADSDAQKT